MATSDDTSAGKDNVFDSSTIKLNPKQEPKAITMPDFRGAEVPLTLIGIYEVKGDELKICVQGVEKAKAKELEKLRPKSFNGKQGILLTFKRDKQ